jgi:formiminotetrahydrofolate cyclodeaminase
MAVRDYLAQLAAATAVPGGGSAAAVAGAMGAALLRMSAKVSQRRADAAGHAQLEALLPELDQLQAALTGLAQEDIDAFRGVLAARKLAPDTPDRSERVARALEAAARVPLQTARAAGQALELAARLDRYLWPPLASDAATAKHLLLTALDGGLANVAANLKELSSPVREQVKTEYDALDRIDRGRYRPRD